MISQANSALLQQTFGFSTLRPEQEPVVEHVLSGKDSLVLMPTGGGKSLCYQFPAICMEGIAVVISPLIALMKDQVDVLKNRFDITAAVAINGLLSPLERGEAIKRVESGGANLLYISPESLRSRTIMRLLKKRLINRFVIDEAHCFSAWGQDFRVDYLYIARFLKRLQTEKGLHYPIPVSCFTATAKPKVIEDIQYYFKKHLNLNLNLYQTSAKRKNLHYFVIKTSNEEDRFLKLVELLQAEEGPKIVYVSRVKRAEGLAEDLGRR
mgnify:CR=1 FL=1